MIVTSSVPANLQMATDKLIQQLQRFTNDTFNRKPDPESWSAAEVGEHIWSVNKNLCYVMQADGKMPDRAPDEKLKAFKEVLLNRSVKIEAPENVRPAGAVKDIQEITAGLQKQLQIMLQVLETKNLNELCEVYTHPRLGQMTRLEWGYFIAFHMERHCQQLEEIHSKVATNAGTQA